MNNKIVVNIWIANKDGKIQSVLDYYYKAFNGDIKLGHIIPLGDTPSGNAELCEVEIYENKYLFMVTAKEHHALNDAISLIINCENQNEIDKFWNYFTQEGEESVCGWCIDKYGLRWQIVPHNLSELMAYPGAFDVMMKQKKIIISEYIKQ